jgi:3-carboxy-cis,cis-muconate cycloisomerase
LFSPLVDVFGDQEVIRLFSEESLVAAWLEVERALAAAQAELGVIPSDAAREIASAARPEHVDLAALREQTLVVGYPILPLLDQIVRRSPGAGRHLHHGATTQDIMDTGLALVAGRALDRVESLARTLGDRLATLAQEHRRTVMPGRTHAQPAVPIAFGSKAAIWLSELARHVERLRSARAGIAVVQLHGAAGTAAALGPRSRDVRHGVARRLGLRAVDVPWHAARDGVAEAGFALAAVAGLCGRLAREVVELARPEIGELREGGGGHHRGASSTMPQKENPIGSEAVIGMSLLASQQVGALLVALQGTHERSAGEWQVEWDAVPAVFAAAAGAVAGAARIAEGLRVFPGRMRANLELEGGTIMAEAAMMAVGEVLGRAEAHAAVYEASAFARSEGVSLAEALRKTLAHDVLAALPPLEDVLDPDAYLGETDAIVSAACESWSRVMSSSRAVGTARP